MSAVKENVMATVERMTSAFHDGDIEGVMACYEDPAVVVFEPGGPVADRSALRAAFQEMFGMAPRFEYQGHEVFAADDLALHFAPWTMKATGPDGEIRQSGLSVAVLRRQADGRWLMAIDNPHGQHLLGA